MGLLRWARKVSTGNSLPVVSHDPVYERFIKETGIEFERDLEAAVDFAEASPYPDPKDLLVDMFAE